MTGNSKRASSRWKRIVVAVIGGVILIAGGLYWALVYQPTFYRAAIDVDEPAMQEAGDEFERRLLSIHNAAHDQRKWQVRFTEDQINGWLATDLRRASPGSLPRMLKEPRVRLRANQASLACLIDGRIPTVVTLHLDVQVSDKTNELAFRIRGVRAGLLPLPLSRVLETIENGARRTRLPLRWAQEQGDPVALLTIPPERVKSLVIESVAVEDHELLLSGTTVNVNQRP